MVGPRHCDYLIVGGGLAASSAVDGILETDPEAAIVMVTEESEPPYQRPPLSKEYLQYADLPRSLLYVKPEDWLAGQDRVDLVTRQRVLVLDPAAMSVTTARGNVFAARRILLATGGRASNLDVPGADLPGIFTLRTVEDAEAIRDAAGGAGHAVMIGAGFVGMEVAASLRSHDTTSTIIEIGDRVWPRILPPDLSPWMRGLYEERDIGFRLGALVKRFRGNRRVEEVVIADETLPCDFVVVGVGMQPRSGLAADAGLAVADGILVDEFGETSHGGVFAAGDVARFPDPFLGGSTRVEHWEHAREHGKLVGRNMAGGREPYGLLSHFFSRVFDRALDAVGRTGDAESILLRGRTDEQSFSALATKADRVIGVLLVNAPGDLEAARELVRLAPRLADLGPRAGDPEAPLRVLVDHLA